MNSASETPSGTPAVPDGVAPAAIDDVTDAAELLKASARGNEVAFARLYDLTATRGYGLALRVVRNPAHAEEVTQEAYLEVWRSASRFDPARGSALSWLLTIVHRKAVDRVRSVEAATRRDHTFHDQTQAADRPGNLPDSTAEAATASMEAKRVRRALDSLTSIQREALELAYFGGYTHTQVATLLDLPVGTAKTRIRDGLIRLRDTLGVGLGPALDPAIPGPGRRTR